jgi:hypothetical protein
MPSRFVGRDRARRIAFSQKGTTVIVVNQDGNSDVFISRSEEELMNAFGSATGGNLDSLAAARTNLPTIGTKVAANGGQATIVDYIGELWAIASGIATPAGGGTPVLPAGGPFDAVVRVTPG